MELVIVEPAEGRSTLAGVAQRAYLPNATRLHIAEGDETGVAWADGKTTRGGPTAYVCFEGLCKAPTSDPGELELQLAEVPKLTAPPIERPADEATRPRPK